MCKCRREKRLGERYKAKRESKGHKSWEEIMKLLRESLTWTIKEGRDGGKEGNDTLDA